MWSIHYLPEHNKALLFDRATMKFLKISARVAQILELQRAEVPHDVIASRLGLPVATVLVLLQRVADALHSKHPVAKVGGLARLSLNVAHLCNLRCRYCYAGEGDYGLGPALMPVHVALASIDMVFERFQDTRTIQFFGGEPLLNLPVIRAVCEYVTTLARTKGVPVPHFGLITNLTILPEGLEEIVNHFKLHITVSLDGPQDINDLHRVFPDGKGTYEIISANIKRLQKSTGQPAAIEATVTKDHARLGYTQHQLMRFFAKNFGIATSIIAPVWEPEAEEVVDPCPSRWTDEREKDIAYGVAEGGLLDAEKLQDIIPLLLGAQSPLWCGAGIFALTITPVGDIFPCHLFLHHPDFRMGNVMDRSWHDSVVLRLRENSKINTPKCEKCEGRWMCRACPAGTLTTLGTVNPSRDERFCSFIRERAAHALEGFVRLVSNEDTRRDVLAAIKRGLSLDSSA